MNKINVYKVKLGQMNVIVRFFGDGIEKIFDYYNVPYKKLTKKEAEYYGN